MLEQERPFMTMSRFVALLLSSAKSLLKAKIQNMRDDPAETKGIKQALIVVLTDGQDNSGTMPWTDPAAASGQMQKGLAYLVKVRPRIGAVHMCTVDDQRHSTKAQVCSPTVLYCRQQGCVLECDQDT